VPIEGLIAKSTADLRLSLDSAIAQSELQSRLIAERSTRPKLNKNDFFTFSLIFGFSPNLRLRVGLSEKVKSPIVVIT